MPRGVSRYDEARLQRRLWTPDLIRPQVEAWYDFGDLSTMTFATGCSEARDKSGRERHISQATGSLQPTLTTWRGKPALLGDKAAQRQLANFSPSISAPACVIMSVRPPTSSSGAFINIGTGANDVNAGYAVGMGNTTLDNTGALAVALYNWVAWSSATLTNIADKDQIMSWRHSGAHWRIWPGGTYTSGTGTARLPAIGIEVFGYSDGGTHRYISATIGEVLILNTADLRIIELCEGHMAWNRNAAELLPASHPYRQSPPLI